MRKELSVIIPAYNEAERIAATLREIADYLQKDAYQFELLVLNDGSNDKTATIVLELSSKIPQIRLIDRDQNCGKGQTIREGVGEASYPYCLFIDADNSTSIREWPAFEKMFDDDCDAVIASRHLPHSRLLIPQPLGRWFFGTGYRILCRLLFGLKISDFNCGFKAYETPLAQKIYSQTVMNDWTFDVEVLARLEKEKAKVVKV